MALPIVAIVGRPNVGKSTLVNRIAQTGDAIVHEMRGVTRDRSYHKADWNGVEFMLIDTGGIEMGGDDAFQGSIRAQAFEGAREADVIIFLVDGKAGINTDDEEVARILQKAGKPVFVAVNKMDNPARMDEVWEFYALGLGDPWPVSAQHGNGTGDLLDEVVNELRKVEVVPEEEVDAINVAIIGRPNAAPPATPSTPWSSTRGRCTASWTPRACAARAKSTRTWNTTASCGPCAPSIAPTWPCSSSTARWASPTRTSAWPDMPPSADAPW